MARRSAADWQKGVANLDIIQQPRKFFKVTKANADLPNGLCEGLTVGVAGTLNFTDEDGVEVNDYPVNEGQNAMIVLQVRLGGTADDIWALYN